MRRRLAVGVEYDGSAYAGWQTQRAASQRAGSARSALSAASPTSRLQLICAGRTDAGVHATGQVAHFDTAGGAHRARLGARRQHLPAARISACVGRGAVPAPFSRPLQRRWRAPIATSSSTAVRARRWLPARALLVHHRAGCRRACARPRAGCWASMISAPFAPPNARRTRRSASCGRSRRARRRLDHASMRPPMPSCTTWCATSSGCCLQSGWARSPPQRARELLESRQRSTGGSATAAGAGPVLLARAIPAGLRVA